MPQLEISSFSSQIFWLAISFIALFLLLSKIIIPKISILFEERNSIIESDLARAEQAKIMAEAIERSYNNSVEEAYNKANKLIEEAKLQIKEETNNKIAELNIELDKKLIEAEEKISKVKSTAEEEIVNIAQSITDSVYNNLFNQYLDKEKLDNELHKSISSALKELNS